MSQNKSALSIPAQIQQVTLQDINNAFAQLCFDYGALVTIPDIGNNEKLKWFAEHSTELASLLMAIYRKNGGL